MNVHKPTLFQFILRTLKPFRWQVAGLIFVACYWSLHVSLQSYVIKLILDSVSINPSFSYVIIPVFYYVIISFANALNFLFYEYVNLNFYPQLKVNITEEAVAIVRQQSYGFFQDELAGSVTDKIKNLSRGVIGIVGVVIDRFLSHILASIIACITLFTVSPMLTLVLITWASALIILSFLNIKKARILSHEATDADSTITGSMVDFFSNIINVRLFSANRFEERLLGDHLEKAKKKDQTLRRYLLKVTSTQGFATAVMVSACLLVLVSRVDSNHISVGDFGLVVTLALSFSEIMVNISHEIIRFSEVYGVASQGLALINQKIDLVDHPDSKVLKVTKGEIKFKNVNFHYGNSEPIFMDQSVTIKAGQKVGLVGYSGSGKSTFVNLILRLFDVESGQILIDDQDIARVTQDSLHHSIAVIPQDPILFNRTLLENIRYGKIFATDEEVIEASRKAHAHEFIMTFSEGYNAVVGERGIKLSGGQRQRISIARAFLKDAPILLFDEATSALDSVTEHLIKTNFFELMNHKTTIVIAHRLSTLLNLDRILVFKNGKIIEDGTHHELIALNGMYKKLWAAQVGGFIPQKAPQDKAYKGSDHQNTNIGSSNVDSTVDNTPLIMV